MTIVRENSIRSQNSSASATSANTSMQRQPGTSHQNTEPGTVRSVQEFSVKLCKDDRKVSLMRFHEAQNVIFDDWIRAKMAREVDPFSTQTAEEEMPKTGLGSEYGREARELNRRRKFVKKKNDAEMEKRPWILDVVTKQKPQDSVKNLSSKNDALTQDGMSVVNKKFKGMREGGAGENSAYYVFVQGPNNTIMAHSIDEWYKFQPIGRYKTLTCEEAEEEYARRDKLLNYFSLMTRKRLRNEEDEAANAELSAAAASLTKASKKKDLLISEMDEWDDSDDDDDNEDNGSGKNSDDEGKKSKKDKANKSAKNKRKKNVNFEAFEESDDGDEEGRECDYISDSSASESELEQLKEIKSIDQERGLRRLLASDEEDEEDDSDKEMKDDDKKDEDTENSKEGSGSDSNTTTPEEPEAEKKNKDEQKKLINRKKEKEKLVAKKPPVKGSIADASNGDQDAKKATTSISPTTNTPASSPVVSECNKRKATSPVPSSFEPKRMFFDHIPGSAESGITIETVSRYLKRKPMTTVDLLKKFKSKCKNMNKEEIGHILGLVLTKINPTKQRVNNVTYYCIPN